MIYNKLDFDKHISTLGIEEFEIRNAVQAYLFVRRKSDRTETMTISYKDYSPHGFYIAGLSVDIFFNSVEQVLKRAYERSKVKGLYNHTTIHQSLINIVGVNYQLFETEINNDDTFNLVAPEIKKMIENGVIPFFEKYQTLNAVFEDTEKMPIEQMSNFIGQPLPFRRLIIKKLCNDSTYEKYYKLIIDFYRAEDAKEEVKLAEQLHLNLSSQS
jgi:hypothetical protein